jgi:ferredoxin--NADP+ reductase
LDVAEIIENTELAPKVHRLRVVVPRLVKKAKPGQFVIVRVNEEGERVPMSIGGLDPENDVLTMVVQEVGKTSAQICDAPVGSHLTDVVGPLGEPTEIENYGHAVVVGGGIGIAPIYPIALALRAAGNKTTAIIGARSEHLLFYTDELKVGADQLLVTTDDGSYGVKGFVTNELSRLIEEDRPDWVMAIGPVPMMRAVANTTREHNIKTVVSLNPIMIDGTGMCGGCRVSVGGKTQFACVDGPDFDAHDVDFDELVQRQSQYKPYEKESYDEYRSTRKECRLEADIRSRGVGQEKA